MINKLIQAVKNHQSIGIEFVWVIAAQLFMLVGGLATIKLFSNMLSKQEFGTYSLLFSTAGILVLVLFTPLGQINMRFLIVAQQERLVESFKKNQRHMLAAVWGISLLILVPATYWVMNYTNSGFLTYAALVLLTLMMGTQTPQQYLLMAFRIRREGSFAQMIGAVARPTAAYVFLLLLGFEALYGVFGLAAGFLILVLSQKYFLSSSWKKAITEDKSNKKQEQPTSSELGYNNYLSYGAYYVLTGIVAATVLYADRWLLSIWGSIDQVAIYAALMQITLAPVAFGHAILSRLAAPILFASSKKPKHIQDKQFRLLLAVWIAMCSVIMLVTWLFHFQIVQLMTNASYAEYSYLLPWMVLGLLFERSAQIMELKGSMMLNTKIYVYPRLLVVILVSLLEYMFFQFLGFDWLVMGLVCATFLGLLYIVLVNRLKLRGL